MRAIPDLIDRTVTPVENALHDAGLKKTDINMVLLVGGSTRIPAVRESQKNMWYRAFKKILISMSVLQWERQFRAKLGDS